MRKDLQFALRQLIHSPGFTAIAIVTLGLGIGANTSMFSLLNTLMLRPLPYADSAALSNIYRATAQDPDGRIAAADFLDLQRQAPRYGEIAAYATSPATTASSSSASARGRTASAAAPTSSAARCASTASRTRSSACCPRPSTTGGT